MVGAMRLTSLSRSIDGKRALVTGAASGMGRATAHLFADEGARVAVVDLGQDRVDAVVEEIRAAHGDDAAIGVVTDVADLGALHALVETVVGAFGGLDILVNNAGVALADEHPAGRGRLPHQLGQDRRRQPHRPRPPRAPRRAPLPRRRRRPGRQHRLDRVDRDDGRDGRLHGHQGRRRRADEELAVELGRQGITVNCICPGPIRTGMTAGISDADKETYAKRRVPLRRYGDPEEVAQMTLSMCLPAASFLNGAIVPVDGGMTIRHT